MKKTIIILLTSILFSNIGFSQIEEDKTKTTEKLTRLIELIETMYVDSVNSPELVDVAIKAILEKLDPHSAYIPAKRVDAVEAPLKGNFEGVGVRFQIVKDTLFVVQAISGGPSEKVGIQAGDQIIKIDGELIAGTGLQNSGVRKRLLGKKGSKVTVEIKRQGEEDLIEFEIIRDKIPIYSVDASYMIDSTIGYIKINAFARTTIREFYEAIVKLKEQGMKDLILDLQNNGGGYLDVSFHLADQFLTNEKLIVYTKGTKFPRKNYKATTRGMYEKGRLVVLINENSASASEIVSGAIQDWDRGAIVGRRSFGKGLVQNPITLPDNSKVRLTTQRYYTPSGRCIQKSYTKGSKEYRKEKYQRYLSGESFHKDSIKVPDSLIFKTMITKRDVYAGGGIIPDIFVPVDTTGTSPYFLSLLRKGIMNKFALNYVKNNREKLAKMYPKFEHYNQEFDEEKATKELTDFAKKEGVEFDENEFNEAEEAITIRLKALIAQNMWGFSEFYQIFNDLNPTYLKGIEILKDNTYKEIHLEGHSNFKEIEKKHNPKY